MICIINSGTSWLRDIEHAVSENGKQFKIMDLHDLKGCDLTIFSGIIITGASILLTKEENLARYKEIFSFIKELDKPILGICLGHQILGLLYGADITLGDTIDRKEAIEIINQDQLFKGIASGSLFQEAHSEYITVAKDFDLLAKSNSCENEAMKYRGKNIYGVQFHPEESGAQGMQLINNFLALCAS